MEIVFQTVAVLSVLIGTAFSVLGVLGYIRMPDVYTRLHATAKVGVFGGVLLLIAVVVWTPFSIGKALVLIGYLLLTGPVTSHALGSAAYRIGIPLRRAVRDELAERESQSESSR